MPGILDGPRGEDEVPGHQALAIAFVVGQGHRGQVAGNLVELQVHTIAVDEHIQAFGLLKSRGVFLRKTRWRAEQKTVCFEVAAIEAGVQRTKVRPGLQVDDVHGRRQISLDLRIGNRPARQVAGGRNGKIRGGEWPAAACPVVGGAAQITQACFLGIQLKAGGCAGVQGLRMR
ncbi:hypothetical protein D3C76_1348240 [compost metagenome]